MWWLVLLAVAGLNIFQGWSTGNTTNLVLGVVCLVVWFLLRAYAGGRGSSSGRGAGGGR